jgi:oligopeptide/dipeptide ABC transporter ATP-binding protein
LEALLTVDDLKVHFPIKKGLFSSTIGYVYAVDGVSFYLAKGETLGLVGESGCGKTTTGLAILRLIEPTAGDVVFQGQDVTHMGKAQLRALKRQIQMIFQDPYSSLNPRMTINQIIGDPMEIHDVYPGTERKERIAYLLEKVGLTPEQGRRYPHEFSGGQRQRIGVARALALNPDLIIGDEPVSALDVSIQAQIINLLGDLQEKFGLTYLFIAHDLSVVRHISDRVAVMYLGHIVEQGATDSLFNNPRHPYTQALLAAIPRVSKSARRERIILPGGVPSPIDPPSGCPFHPRCFARLGPICEQELPPFFQVGEQKVACWIYQDQPLAQDSSTDLETRFSPQSAALDESAALNPSAETPVD